MTISRFTDPCEQSSNKNLSLDSLQKYITEIEDRGQDLFNSNLKKIGLEVKNIRKMRSKYISHRDYDYALLDKKDIEAIGINKIREIYELLGQCLQQALLRKNNTLQRFKNKSRCTITDILP
jgi:hypothetical protein